MASRKIRPDQKNVAHPKMLRVKGSKSKKAKTPEDAIQSTVDYKIKAYRIYSQRIEDIVYTTLFANNNMPLWKKTKLADSIAGIADNVVMMPINDRFCLCMHLECKSDVGSMNVAQKKRAKQVPYNIIRTEKEFDSILREFNNITDRIVKLLESDIIINKCFSMDCKNEAGFVDEKGVIICEDCMIKRVNNGDKNFEDYKTLPF